MEIDMILYITKDSVQSISIKMSFKVQDLGH